MDIQYISIGLGASDLPQRQMGFFPHWSSSFFFSITKRMQWKMEQDWFQCYREQTEHFTQSFYHCRRQNHLLCSSLIYLICQTHSLGKPGYSLYIECVLPSNAIMNSASLSLTTSYRSVPESVPVLLVTGNFPAISIATCFPTSLFYRSHNHLPAVLLYKMYNMISKALDRYLCVQNDLHTVSVLYLASKAQDQTLQAEPKDRYRICCDDIYL